MRTIYSVNYFFKLNMNIFITGGSSYLGGFVLNYFPNLNFFALKNNSEINFNSNVHIINKNEFF